MLAEMVLTKRPGEMAINALVGAQLCDGIVDEILRTNTEVDVAPEVLGNYVKFKEKLLDVAFAVLQSAYHDDSEGAVHALQSQWVNSGGIEMWQLAYAVNAKEITAMPAMRLVVEAEWWGNVDETNSIFKILLSIMTGGLYLLFWTPHDAADYRAGRPPMMRNLWYLPMRISTAAHDDGDLRGDLVQGSGTSDRPSQAGDGTIREWAMLATRRVFRFFQSPEINFIVEAILYLTYLLIYSYASLLSPRSWSDVFSFTSQFIWDDVLQVVSLIFVLSHIAEEVHEATWGINEYTFDGIRQGVLLWWESYWNKWDAIMYLLISIGLGMKSSRESDESGALEWSKIILAVGALLLWLRSMRFFAKFPMLGPKTLMVFKMLDDFMIFGALLFTGLIGTGVAMYSVAQPWRGIDQGTPIDILYKPTFRMFGELFLDETMEETGCSSTEGPAWKSCLSNW